MSGRSGRVKQGSRECLQTTLISPRAPSLSADERREGGRINIPIKGVEDDPHPGFDAGLIRDPDPLY